MFDAMFPSHWSRIRKLYWLNKLKNNVATYEVVVGNPVSFTAKAAPLRQLKVAFSPVQSLNGYDSPWPAGGGKNKLYPLGTSYTFPADVSTRPSIGTVNVVSGNTYVISYYQNTTMGSNTRNTLSVFYDNAEHYEDPTANRRLSSNRYSWTYTAQTTGEVTIKLWLNSPDVAVMCDRFMVNEGNTLEDYSPYSNICPISGWSEVTVEQRGVNMWDEEWEIGGINHSTGQNNDSVRTVIRSKNYIPCVPSTVYYFKATGGADEYIHYYDADKNYISYKWEDINKTFTTPANARYIRFNIGANYGTTYNNDISINYPATDTEYHAYNPASRSISISLGETVYSGTVDVVTGVVTVTMAKVTYNGAENWVYESTSQTCYLQLNSMKKILEYDGKILCDKLPTARNNTLMPAGDSITGYKDGRGSYPNNNWLYVGIAGVTSASALKAWLAENPIQVCYELATPQTIQLTPQEVQSLAGDNTMWSNANQPITVTYRSN